MLRAKNLAYYYEDQTLALKNITMDFDKGNIIGIIGANGSGKTTLFLNLLGYLKPQQGQIYFKNKTIKYNKRFLWKLRKSVSIVFQDPDKQIFYSSVYDDVAFGPRNLGLDESEVSKRVQGALECVDAMAFKDRPVHLLSHGQKKRVAIAGVLALQGDVVFLDEPLAGLDPHIGEQIVNIIKDIARSGKKIILSSHDMDLIYDLCDYVYILGDGRVLGEGNPQEVFLNQMLLDEARLKEPWLIKVHRHLKTPLFKKEADLLNHCYKNNL